MLYSGPGCKGEPSSQKNFHGCYNSTSKHGIRSFKIIHQTKLTKKYLLSGALSDPMGTSAYASKATRHQSYQQMTASTKRLVPTSWVARLFVQRSLWMLRTLWMLSLTQTPISPLAPSRLSQRDLPEHHDRHLNVVCNTTSTILSKLAQLLILRSLLYVQPSEHVPPHHLTPRN